MISAEDMRTFRMRGRNQSSQCNYFKNETLIAIVMLVKVIKTDQCPPMQNDWKGKSHQNQTIIFICASKSFASL